MSTLREILRQKGSAVSTVEPETTVLAAIRKMNEERIGALVVAEGDRVIGIFTERDVLRRVVENERTPSQLTVGEVMTRQVFCCSADTSIEEAGRIMKDERVRHLPVCDEGGRLAGLVSIGDVNVYHLSRYAAEIRHLEEYVYASL